MTRSSASTCPRRGLRRLGAPAGLLLGTSSQTEVGWSFCEAVSFGKKKVQVGAGSSTNRAGSGSPAEGRRASTHNADSPPPGPRPRAVDNWAFDSPPQKAAARPNSPPPGPRGAAGIGDLSPGSPPPGPRAAARSAFTPPASTQGARVPVTSGGGRGRQRQRGLLTEGGFPNELDTGSLDEDEFYRTQIYNIAGDDTQHSRMRLVYNTYFANANAYAFGQLDLEPYLRDHNFAPPDFEPDAVRIQIANVRALQSAGRNLGVQEETPGEHREEETLEQQQQTRERGLERDYVVLRDLYTAFTTWFPSIDTRTWRDQTVL
ncbi:unnamed protein product [Amoebophrya sp. A120]|nr:unnamed protein product [Amoebophrya sp. A120]|eukprot:GSA120T00021168001.1